MVKMTWTDKALYLFVSIVLAFVVVVMICATAEIVLQTLKHIRGF